MKLLHGAKSGVALTALFIIVACDEGETDPLGMGGQVSAAGAAGRSGGGSGGRAAGGSGGATGGSGGMAGSPSTMTQTLSFGAGLEGFAVNYYCTAAPAAMEPGTNCVQVDAAPVPVPVADAGADAGDAGVGAAPPIATDFVALTHDLVNGSPDPGSARLTVDFSAPGQQVQLAYNTPNTPEGALNLANKTVTIQVRADVAGATAKIYLKSTGTYVYANGLQATLAAGVWTPLTFDTMAPSFMNAGFVATDIRELGVSFETTVTTLTPIVINVDTVQY